ncbi:MAG: hypothetical protein A2017_20750 [Lentisphaerae bacterium GWF2_44_16]|nr:MAG: hypothetical protein A2017_20750 [Lentisphaerae bacterium GWF2_44_16]
MSGRKLKTVLASFLTVAALFSATATENATDTATVWRFPVNLKSKNINGLVDVTDIRINEHLLHYTDNDRLTGLTMDMEYNVITPAQCYLSTSSGSMYWYNINLSNLNQSCIFTRGRIDLSNAGKHKTIASFTSRDQRYFNNIAKGPNVIRGCHGFAVKNEKGVLLGTTGSIWEMFKKNKKADIETAENTDELASPEKAFLGNGVNDVNRFYKNTLYTLANLENYRIEIADFSSGWKSGGTFAFRIYVVDADNNRYEVNRADIDATGILKTGEIKLDTEQAFDKYSIPLGYFSGKFGVETPEKIEIKIRTVAMSPRGREEKITERTFTKDEDSKIIIPGKFEKKAAEPAVEGRIIFMHPAKDLSRDPKEGMEQLRNIVRRAKENNFNVICPTAMGHRCMTGANLENKYFQRYFKEWDPFAEFRKICSEFGMELQAAVAVIPEGGEKLKGILIEHPEWAARSREGTVKGWLDPAVPEVKEYRIKDIVELVKKYDLDGICLDFCRLSGGPSDRGAEIYKAETGIDPRKVTIGSKEYIDWYMWTGNHLTDLVKRIHEEIKKAKPDCKLSAYVQGVKFNGEDKYREYHQNFTEWLRKGYLDMIYPTGYVYDMLRFKSWTAKQIQACREANPKVPVMVAIGVRSSHGALQNAQELSDQIDILRKLNGSGAFFFAWVYLEKWLEDARKNSYTHPASIP